MTLEIARRSVRKELAGNVLAHFVIEVDASSAKLAARLQAFTSRQALSTRSEWSLHLCTVSL